MTNKELKKALSQISSNIPEPNPERIEFLRQRLISKIKFEQFNKEPQNMAKLTFQEFISSVVHPWRVLKSLGAVTTTFALLIVITFGGAVSANADPGDTLYGVKIAIERLPLVLPIVTEETKVNTELKLAERRQGEITRIMASHDSNQLKSKKIKAAAKHLSRSIESTQKRVEKMGQGADTQADNKVVAAVASSAKTSVNDIKKSLDQVSLAVEQGEIDGDTQAELKKVSQAVSGAEISILGVLIDTTIDTVEELKDEPQENVVAEDQEVDNEVDNKETVKDPEVKEPEELKEADILDTTPDSNTAEVEKAVEPEIIIIEETPAELDVTESKSGLLEAKKDEQPEEDTSILKEQLNTEAVENETNIKEQIIKDLEEVIEDLEIRAEDAEGVGEAESAVGVVLNVEEVIDQEMQEKSVENKKKTAQDLLDTAKEDLETGNLKEAFDNIAKAQEVLE